MIPKKELKILLVNSDLQFLESTKEALANEGYNITTARGAKEAIELLNCSIFHLVITNLYLREGDGPQIMQWSFLNRPHIRAILTSEKLPQDRLEGFQEFSSTIGNHRALAQPFATADLSKLIKDESRKF